MKKIKLLKTLLIPSLGVLTLGTITTIATSCGEQPKPSTYSVSGGSTQLFGTYGTAGSDEKTWVLKKDGQEVTDGVTWSIVELVKGISITDGKVSWTNAISSGTYKFKAVASYNNQTYTSQDITLTIASKCEVTGGRVELFGSRGVSGSDDKTWVLKKDGQEVTEGVTWSIVKPVSGVSINNGKVSWTNAMEIGTYSFKVAATYNEQTCLSTDITLTISSESEVTGGSTSLTGYQGVSGSDEKTWVFKRDGEIKTNVIWSIVEPVSGVSITDGKVSWTDTIPVGNYSFLVEATYGDETFNSQVVTLTIANKYKVDHGSTQLFGAYGKVGSDDKTWVLKKDGEVVTDGVTWSIVEPVSGVSIVDGKVSWTNAMKIGTYRFKVAAAYNEQTYYSVDITLVINASGYEAEGGSLALNGVYGTDGSDEKTWVLKKDGEVVTEGVTWSIDETVAGVSINDGKVSWVGAIQSGTYKFKVVATYEDQMFASNTITLTINGLYQLVGESKTIDFVATNTGRDERNEWHLMKDGEIVSEGVIWSLVPAAGSSAPNWIKLNENKEISWTNAVEGTYSFNIQAEYDEKTFTSSSPFVLIVAAKTFECVEVLANKNSTLELVNQGGNNPNLSYSFDGIEWNSYIYNPNTSPISISKDQTLYLRGRNLEGWSSSEYNYSRFNIAGDVSISGNVMGLLDDGIRAVRDIPCGYCFTKLFYLSSGITSVSDNFLPSLNLKKRCYDGMFEGCISLTEAPQLPATILESGCYSRMFQRCASLTEAPELPATAAKSYCYSFMFSQCESLINTPQLPATNLDICCYWGMFENCASLTEAYLPSDNLYAGIGCYKQMFSNCSSMNSIKIGYTGLASDAPDDAFLDWVKGVAETGTFYYNGPDYVHPSLFYFPPLWVRKNF